jgi:hypothetical protein
LTFPRQRAGGRIASFGVSVLLGHNPRHKRSCSAIAMPRARLD